MSSDPQRPDVPRLLAPRFSLRSLLLWMTLLCGLLALLVSVSLGPAIVIASVAVLIGAHVVGNALGTRLRDQAPRITDTAAGRCLATPVAADLPVTSLRNKQRLSRTTPVVACVAALLGALVGGVVLAWFNPQGTLAGLVVGGLSCGFLGGFVGFLAGSFLEIFGPAWTEAASLAPDPPRRPRPARVRQGTGRPTLRARLASPLRWLARR
ncbi:MAG: hypothetical protein U0836_08550 [Pirellulales bacterium]